MQAQEVLHKLLEETCAEMHAARRTALEVTVWAALRGQALTVTALGRAIESAAHEKHNIKRAGRLLSNGHLHGYWEAVYAALIGRLIGAQRHPLILVDWSDLDAWRRHQLLRASLVVGGRALTLYEQVHGRKTAVKRRTHRDFLRRLQGMLPADCQPVVVTDAGFRTPWFREVETLGWGWVARVRHRTRFQCAGREDWPSVQTLHAQATAMPKDLGGVLLARSEQHPCRLVLYKAKPKGRRVINRYGRRSRSQHSVKAARAAREPWLLATNLPKTYHLTRKVVRVYRQRMQIEEAFRDVKSAHCGLGLEHHRSRDAARLAILLLIGALALLVLWWIGTAARYRGIDRHYQANTVRVQPVLSVIFLGLRIVERGRETFSAAELAAAGRTITTLNIKIRGDRSG